MSRAYFVATVLWTVIPSFQFGYHTSALNQLQNVMSCRISPPSPSVLGLPACVPMTDTEFGVLTGAFTVGGLLGSIGGGYVSDRWGRKGGGMGSAGLTVLGAGMMAVAPSYWLLLLGRLVVGLSSGIALCVVPVMLSELAPARIKGLMGTLNQIGIVAGVLLTQCLGLALARPGLWRFVLVVAAGVSALQLLFGPGVTDTPAWLEDKGREAEAERAAAALWGAADPHIGDEEVPEPEQAPLLGDEISPAGRRKRAGLLDLFRDPELRLPLVVTVLCFVAQQGSGINAVMFYSSNILAGVLPELAGYVSIIIAAINAIMTFPPVFIIDRVGKRAVLLTSIAFTVVSGVLVAIGLDIGEPVLSAVGIVLFVAAFAAGLGPVPFVITAQIAPYYAVSTLSSVALSVQWLVNFLVAVTFLPLRTALSFGKGLEGNVFVLFIAILAVCGVSISRLYHERTVEE